MADVLDQQDTAIPKGLKPIENPYAGLPKGLTAISGPGQVKKTEPAPTPPPQKPLPAGLQPVERGINLKTGLPHSVDNVDFEHQAAKPPQPKAAPKEAPKPGEHNLTWLMTGEDKAPKGAVIRQGKPESTLQRVEDYLRTTETGRTVENSFDQLSRMMKSANEKLSNPGAMTDAEWAQRQQEQQQFFEKHLGKGLVAGATTGATEFGEEMLSPYQMGLMVGTFGESGLAEIAAKTGIKGAVPAAKTLSKLMSLQFTAQMLEGAASGVENTYKAAVSGDWEAAGRNAIEGLASGLMAKGLVSHEVATEQVRGDLNKTAHETYGKKFDDLNPYEQGLAIDQTVKASPAYQDVLKQADEIETQANDRTKKQRQKKLQAYYGHALDQAWDPNAAKRTIRGLERGRKAKAGMEAEEERQQSIREVIKTVRAAAEQRARAINEAAEAQRQAGIEERPERRAEASRTRSERERLAGEIQGQRDEVYARRQEALEATPEVAQRHIDAVKDDQGNVSYLSNYWGEDQNYGVASDAQGHAVYRQTPRGIEWMEADGNFSEDPAQVFNVLDPQHADTVARLSALSQTADSLAETDEASPEQKQDAEFLANLRRQVVSGEISPRDAQKQAGIAEKVSLSDEFNAAREGRLNGPFNESNAGDYLRQLEDEARAAGLDDEGIKELTDNAGHLAQQQTENNLHHVYQPGDYIVSKRGVKWTLDSKGLLHPDDGGQPVALRDRGFYSNQAMQIAASGRVGYGTQTREERRVSEAKRREVEESIREEQQKVNEAMRLAKLQEGLELAHPEEPVADIEAKLARERRRMTLPPRREGIQAGNLAKTIAGLALKAPADASSIINVIARQKQVSPEEVMRLHLANDPALVGTAQQKIANLEVGDKLVEPVRKSPWMVERGKDDGLYLRSGNAQPLKLDRTNPSQAVLALVDRTTVEKEVTPETVRRAAFESPHYARWQEEQTQIVEERKKNPPPPPRSEKQAKAEVKAAVRRTDAAISVATKSTIDALNPEGTDTEQALKDVAKAEGNVKLAEEAYVQEVEAKGRTEPADTFPQKAPVGIGLRGNAGEVKQNSHSVPIHYELVPLQALTTSHEWQGRNMVENPAYPGALQPRTISESEAAQNALRGERGTYDFREYADNTINGSMGPAIVDAGGQVVGGNTRIAILRKHLENIERIADPVERDAAMRGLVSGMKQLAQDSGISRYPDDGKFYAVVRMMDEPIRDTRQAAELGRLFNKKIGVEISKSAKGVSYSKSFDEPLLAEIGRLIDVHDGITPAIVAEPEFFNKIVSERFGIGPEEEADWFREVGNDQQKYKVLSEDGRSQFTKALMGTIFKDASVLNRLEGKTAYRAAERALGYIVQMKGLPERDIVSKIQQAIQASVDTLNTDPGLAMSGDKWAATYRPSQIDFLGMESSVPPEPDRMVEALWRAAHASDAAVPRTLSDRLKNFIGEETAKGGWLIADKIQTPTEVFNDVFRKELREVAYSRGDEREGLSEPEYQAALENTELAEQEREPEKKPEVAETKPEAASNIGLPPPPPFTGPEEVAARELGEAKKVDGYVTPQALKTFLETNPATKKHANEIFRLSKLMAEYVAKDEGIESKDALDWVLRERLAGIESGDNEVKRGGYSDPNIETGYGTKILSLYKAADPTTFVHEFAHVLFPLLSDEDLKAIDTIKGPEARNRKAVFQPWDGNRASLKGNVYRGLSEKFAHGLEQFLRDENPTGFTHEVKMLLARVKDMMRKVYLAFKSDPLSPYRNSEESREVFARMLGITDFDLADEFRKEVEKARAKEKKLTKPGEDPLQKIASELGAKSVVPSISGRVEDSIGERVDPRKPTAVMFFDSQQEAVADAWRKLGTEGAKIKNAELVESPEGEWGIRFNTDKSVLHQDLPEKNVGDLGVELESLEKELKTTPSFKIMNRKLLELKIDNLKNKIRASYGTEPLEEKREPELAKAAIEETKNGRTGADRVREESHGISGVEKPQRPGGISKPPLLRVPRHGSTGLGGGAVRGPLARASLSEVKPVELQPLGQRKEPVGLLKGQAFDQKAWVDGLKRAGLPEDAPAPSYALNPKTAEVLKYPGQKQIVQLAMSALEQGDGFVIASPPGTGKTFAAAASAKEFLSQHPDAPILFVTKNRTLKNKTTKVGANYFGLEIKGDIPKDDTRSGVYAVSYMGMLNDRVYSKIPWKLIIADESGEARNWYKDENQQGKMLRDVINNSEKAIYMSATPFHCLAPGTSVLMHNGTVKPVEKVCVGDLVMGPDSQPRLVRKLSHGFGQMYDVIPKKGDSYKVNENHILSLRMAGRTIPFQGAYGKRYLGWRKHPPNSVVNVSIRDYLQMRPNGLRSRLLGYRTSIDFPECSVPIDPYWLGLWLGDGSSREPSICVAEIDPEIKQYIQEYAERIGLVATEQKCKVPTASHCRISKGKRGFMKGSNRIIPPNPLTVRLRGLGLLGKNSINKHIPDMYKANSRDVRLRLLAGIIDSDGCCSHMHTTISTKSKRLADDIAFLARSLGFAAYPKPVFYALSKFPKVPNWIVGLSGDLELIPVLLPRKKCPKRKVLSPSQNQAMTTTRNAKDVLKVGIRVEPCGVGEFYGFELDGDQLFVLGDFTVTHNSPMEYGYLDKLKLWPQNGFDRWIESNFAHEKVKDKIVARLDPPKQAKLRAQLIERGQMISQAISYEGMSAHFGVVPVTDGMKRSLDRIREGFARARDQFVRMGRKGMAEKAAAFEATYTKAFLERAILDQNIELARRARRQGWQVILASETSSEDLFHRPRSADEEPSTYQQLDDAMGGQLSRIIPPFESVFDRLKGEFGEQVVDYSGRGNTLAERERSLNKFLAGEAPIVYTTYAAGGIGVDMHDADYPDLNIKGGDKPRVMISLGAPYSGVLLEQMMGRPWRNGVKSDVHVVILTTDAEPDIRLMQTKVGPRMRALRAAVLGEKDSLASAMSNYSDDQKVRERQDMMAYAEGDEQKVNASRYAVRQKGRQVGIQDWSQINFPSAEDAKHKGMKYGEEVTGGDWSNLYQAKFDPFKPPETKEQRAANEKIDEIANAAVSGKVDEVKGLDGADRKMAAGLASAEAATQVDIPVDRDLKNAAEQAMKNGLKENAYIDYHGIVLSQELGMVNIARRDKKPEVGHNLVRMNRSYRADWDVYVGQNWKLLEDSFKRNNLEFNDANVREMSFVLEGKKVSANPQINALAADISDMMRMAHSDMAKAGVQVSIDPMKKISYSEFPEDPKYFPHMIDWDYEIHDPETGEGIKVRDLLKIDQQRAEQLLRSVPELRSFTYQRLMDYLRRKDPRAPRQGNIHFTREVNFPFIKRDKRVLIDYFDQVGEAISAAKNFGRDEEKLNGEIKKLSNPNARETINAMYRSALHPQNWEGISKKIYDMAVTYEIATKMTFSAVKVPFHLALTPVVMKGRFAPLAHAVAKYITDPEVRENAAYVGTVARQSNAGEMLFGEHMGRTARRFLRSGLTIIPFESVYKAVRVIAGESARVYLDQYALNDLRKGGTRAEHTRRMLKDVFLIGDKGIDDAIMTGHFGPEDMAKAEVAFTNQAAFSGSGDPMQMPGAARLETPLVGSQVQAGVNRAIRLTYALQSFSVKAVSLLREHLYDEVVVHRNTKPLMYAILAMPALGTLLNLAGTGVKHIAHHGIEGLTGQPKTKDSWDTYLAYLEDTFQHPTAVKFLKWFIDSYALSAALDTVKTLSDPLLNMAQGKPAKADKYWLDDLTEHLMGPFYSDVWRTGKEAEELQQIQSGKKHPELKGRKEEKSILRYAADEVPVLKQIPFVEKRIHEQIKPPSGGGYR